jgi:hypothetical protein
MALNSFGSILFVLVGFAILGQAAPPAADNQWWLARTTENGNELLFRVRATFPDEATIARYPYLAIVDWVYQPRPDGMPNRDTSEQMYALEDLLEEKLENVGAATLAFTRTGNGKRQWNYYVADRNTFKAAISAETRDKHNFPVHIHFVSDPSWQALREVHRSAGG